MEIPRILEVFEFHFIYILYYQIEISLSVFFSRLIHVVLNTKTSKAELNEN